MRTSLNVVAWALIAVGSGLHASQSGTGGGAAVDQPLAQGGFSWILDGTLAAMPLPGAAAPVASDLQFVREQGVGLLISLTEEPMESEVLEHAGLTGRHIPVPDFTAPSINQLTQFVEAVDSAATQGRSVGVHCTAGLGRSGTFAAAYLVSQGSSTSEAISRLRMLRPGSVETAEQEARIREFELILRPEVESKQ